MNGTAELYPADSGPVFILTASRSGSTLLRFILDSHPDLACPPETMIGSACVTMVQLFECLEHFGFAGRTDVHASPGVSAEGLSTIRNTIENAYGSYLKRTGKKRWCDKSLDTYQVADIIQKIYPEARFICLVRHCMDVIVSGARNCPWGVSRYGFDPFVAQYPGNTVAAIGAYWLSCVQTILAFQEKNPDRCFLVRYEDLVTSPESTVADILSFIDAAPAPGITDACFRVAHEGRGPGDEKIWFTDRVTPESMGQGITVPMIALPAPMRDSINEVLTKLRYKIVDDNWNGAVGRIDPRADSASCQPVSETSNGAGTEADVAVRSLRDRLAVLSAETSKRVVSQWPSVAGGTVRLVAESASGEHAELTVQFADGNGANKIAAPGGADGVPLMIASGQVWLSLLERRANIITEIFEGRLRCFNPNDTHRLRTDEMHAVASLLGLANVPVATWPNGAAEPMPLA